MPNVRFGSIAAQLFSLSVAPYPLLSNRVLNGACRERSDVLIAEHRPYERTLTCVLSFPEALEA
jgi:hypothetical protein